MHLKINSFLKKSKFYSDSKQKTVSSKDYENSKYLYLTLKIRNLIDINDLYNIQWDSTYLFEVLS